MLWLSIATFNDAKPRLKVVSCSVNEFVGLGGLPHLETLTWQNMTPAERVTQTGKPAVGNNFRLYKNNADLQNNLTLPW